MQTGGENRVRQTAAQACAAEGRVLGKIAENPDWKRIPFRVTDEGVGPGVPLYRVRFLLFFYCIRVDTTRMACYNANALII